MTASSADAVAEAEATAYCPGIGFPLCASDSKNFDCWHMNIARKTQGALAMGGWANGVSQIRCLTSHTLRFAIFADMEGVVCLVCSLHMSHMEGLLDILEVSTSVGAGFLTSNPHWSGSARTLVLHLPHPPQKVQP